MGLDRQARLRRQAPEVSRQDESRRGGVYGEDGGPATTLVLSADGGLSLTDDEFNPIEVLYEGADDD